MDKTAFFQDLGLTQGEIKVYLALLHLGTSAIGAIGKESKVSKSKMYDILDRLIEKGMVGYVIKQDAKYFSANDPQMIMRYIEKKQEDAESLAEEAKKIIPQLCLERDSVGKVPIASVYEGFRAFTAVREELLPTIKKGDDFLVLGAPRVANERWESQLLKFHKHRESKGIGMRIIYNFNAKEFGAKRRELFKMTKVRYLPSDLIAPNWIDIFPGAVIFAVIIKGEPICTVIRDIELAKSMKSYFEIMWKASSD